MHHTTCMRKNIWSSRATAFWMNQVCTWRNHPGVWIPYVRPPHLVFQLHLHSSHVRNLPSQVSNQAPALSNESPISKHGSPFPLSGIPSHLLSVSIHPIYPSNCNLPLTPSPLAWVIILNYWQGDCIVWTFIYGKLIYWAPFHSSGRRFCVTWLYLHISFYTPYWSVSPQGQSSISFLIHHIFKNNI